MSSDEYENYQSDGELAKTIAASIPFYPFKGIERFYDIQGFLSEPILFKHIVNVLTARYRAKGVTKILGMDARGFILGPPVALALEVPFVMIRKKGKMPNTISSEEYNTEYGKREGVCLQRGVVGSSDRVVIIDDLVATGGTLASCATVVKAQGATIVECSCVVELKFFIESRNKLFKEMGISDVPVWGMISEGLLTVAADLVDGYVDDGEEH